MINLSHEQIAQELATSRVVISRLLKKLENDKKDIIKFSNNTALAYTQLGKNERAIEIYYETLKLAEKEDDKKQVGKLLNNIGLIYENMNQFKNALCSASLLLPINPWPKCQSEV